MMTRERLPWVDSNSNNHNLPHSSVEHASPRKLLLSVVAVVLLGTLALLGFVVTPRSSPCQTYDKEIPQVQKLLEQGKTDLAAGFANLYLSNNNACSQAEMALATVGYEAGKQELYKHPELGVQTVERWKELEDNADKHRVPKNARSPMTIFTLAYNSGMWDLAQASFIAGWEQGLVGPQDRQAVSEYYASLFNLGYTILEKGNQKDYERALQAIATAAAISNNYGMIQLEAKTYLETRFGQNEDTWPKLDKNDPVLNKTQGGQQ